MKNTGNGRKNSSAADSTYIVFDIGGTTMRVAALEEGAISEPVRINTPKEASDGVAALVAAAKDLARGRRITGVCGGVAGIVVHGTLYRSPNLPKWNETNLANLVAAALGAPTTVLNDAALAALGEFHYGMGKSAYIMAYITVSTGVGGARIVEGMIDETTYGFEVGHQLVNGTELESLVSGTAARARFGVDPKDLPPEAREELAETLAIGLYNTTLHWSPDTIVLGGSMITGKSGIPLDRVTASLTSRLAAYYPTAPAITRAALEKDGGLYGAMAYLLKVP